MRKRSGKPQRYRIAHDTHDDGLTETIAAEADLARRYARLTASRGGGYRSRSAPSGAWRGAGAWHPQAVRPGFDCDVLVTELAPHGDDLGDSGGGRVMAHDVRGRGRDILGDQPGIEPIVLGEGAASAGELPKSVGIDATHRQAGGEQGAEDAALVAATRL